MADAVIEMVARESGDPTTIKVTHKNIKATIETEIIENKNHDYLIIRVYTGGEFKNLMIRTDDPTTLIID